MQEMGGPMYKLKVTYEIQAVSGKSFNVYKIYSFVLIISAKYLKIDTL